MIGHDTASSLDRRISRERQIHLASIGIGHKPGVGADQEAGKSLRCSLRVPNRAIAQYQGG